MSGLDPCAYCGGPDGFVAGPGHAFHCHRYKPRPRRVKTIRGPKAKLHTAIKVARAALPQKETT